MAPGITNNGHPVVLAPSVLPGGVGQVSATPGFTYEEEAAAYQQYEEQARDAVAGAFAGASGVSKLVGIFAREPASASSFFATLSDICDEPRYSEHFGTHINIPSKTPRRWLEEGAVTKQTVTTAKSLGWSAVKHNESLFLVPPSSVLSDIISSRDYQLLVDAGVSSPVFIRGGIGLSNLDLLEMELFNIAPSQTQNIFHPDNYLLRSLDEAFEDGYMLVNINDSNFLIREEFLSQDAKWTLLRLKTTGVVHVRGTIGLDGDNKAVSQGKGRVVATDDIVPVPSGGDLDLAELQVRQWDRWSADPRAVVDLSKHKWLSTLTELYNWLGKNIKYVEPQDLERLRFFVAAAQRSETTEALDAIIGGVKGVVAEIAARSSVHAEYLQIQKVHKDAIMLVAPQIHDGNILEASDAIIGEITADGKMIIYSVWEIAFSENVAEQSRKQLNDTLRRRFAERGIQLRDNLNRGTTLEVTLNKDIVKNVLVGSSEELRSVLLSTRERMLAEFASEFIASAEERKQKKSTSSKYSTATLILKLRTLAVKLGRSPTMADLNNLADMPSPKPYADRFGTFTAALKAAGLEANKDTYTDGELLELLKAFAKKINRVPTTGDISAAEDMPHATSYQKRFGSFNTALVAAGFKPNQPRYTDDELIVKLRAFAARIVGVPRQEDIAKDPDMPGVTVYVQRFGTLAKALRRAGLEPNREEHSDEELIRLLTAYVKKIGHVPKIKELDAEPSMPCAFTYSSRFGNWENALEKVGLKPHRKNFSKKDLTDLLTAFGKKLGHVPSVEELEGADDMPSYPTYTSRFGSFAKAKIAAGLEVEKHVYSDAEMAMMLKALGEILGHVPKATEVSDVVSMPSAATYGRRFGTFNAAIRAAGFQPNVERHTDDDLIAMLKKLAVELGRTPTWSDVEAAERMPCGNTFSSRFGDFDKALIAAGLIK